MNLTPQSVQSVPSGHVTGNPYDSCTEPEPPSSHRPLLAKMAPLCTHVS